jgi:hypothetical protein
MTTTPGRMAEAGKIFAVFAILWLAYKVAEAVDAYCAEFFVLLGKAVSWTVVGLLICSVVFLIINRLWPRR